MSLGHFRDAAEHNAAYGGENIVLGSEDVRRFNSVCSCAVEAVACRFVESAPVEDGCVSSLTAGNAYRGRRGGLVNQDGAGDRGVYCWGVGTGGWRFEDMCSRAGSEVRRLSEKEPGECNFWD